MTSTTTLLTVSSVVIAPSECDQRLLFVTVSSNNVYGGGNFTDVQEMTWNGQSVTKGVCFGCGTAPINCGPDIACCATEYWYILNPTPATSDLVVRRLETDATGAGMVVGVWQINGVDQTTPFGTSVKDSQQSGDCNVVCAGSVGDLMVGWVHARHNHDITAGASQTRRYEFLAVGPASDDRQTDAAGDTKIGAASVTFSFDDGVEGSGEEENKCQCVAVKAAS